MKLLSRKLPLLLALCLPILLVEAQTLEEKQLLCRKWIFTKSTVLGMDYQSDTSGGNTLTLEEDMTFCGLENGEAIQGTWQYSSAEKTISLFNQNHKATKKLRIEQIKPNLLVYSVATEWQYNMVVFMRASQTSLN